MRIGRKEAALALVLGVGCTDSGSPDCGERCPGSPGSPTFAGVRAVAPDRTGTRIRVSWGPGQDDATPSDQLRYNVYASTSPGRALERGIAATSAPGATSFVLEVTPANVVHHVVVRAVDADGLEDANVVEKGALVNMDSTPPTFAGVKAGTPSPHAGVTLTWDHAADDKTPPEGIRYVVYDAPTGAVLTEIEGVTEVTLTDLGVTGDKRRFVVRARDAGDNVEMNRAVVEVALGADTKPPTFGGCTSAVALGSHVIAVTWDEATDAGGPPASVTYDVFAATTAGGQGFVTPNATVVGKGFVLVRDLAPSTSYHLVCRARDAAGNREANTTEVTARTTDDVTVPIFAGATADPLSPDTSRAVTLRWTAGSDAKTPPDKLVYVVYQAVGEGTAFDFTAPRAVSSVNATSITLADLPSRAKVRWIVRARDEDYNEDPNTVESSATTLTSFALDVQPFFAKSCAVVGCHVTPVSSGGLSLSPSVAYASLVNRAASQRPPNWPAAPDPNILRVLPGNPADSYLWRKIEALPGTFAGSQMPALGTGNTLSADEKAIIESWIAQGAPSN